MPKILIVDDDEFVLDYHVNTLSKHFSVATALNGKHALKQASEFNPDLILMDIQMPELDGYDTAETLRRSGNHVPILFFSCLSSLEERLKAYDAGGNDFIAKPADPEEMLKKINVLLACPYAEKNREASEIAIKALSDLSYLGQIIGFFRNSYRCQNLAQLADTIFSVTKLFGLRCSLIFRQPHQKPCYFDDGLTKNIDSALLESLQGAQRIMEFGYYRAAFNWQLASLLVKNMPQDPEKCGAMKDYLAHLMEGIEQCAAKLIMEQNLRHTIEQFSNTNENIKHGIFGLIDDMETQLESLFASFDVNDELSQATESRLLDVITTARTKADNKLRSGESIENELQQLLTFTQASHHCEPSSGDELF